MAKLTFSQPFNMNTTDFFDGDLTYHDAKRIEFSDGVHKEISYGKFTYDENGEILTSKITGIEEYVNDVLHYAYTGLKVTADGLNAASGTALELQAYLLAGNDKIYGSGGGDVLLGYAGNDAIYGNGDNDQLSGGLGNDKLYGGVGNDTLFGEDGNDALSGDAGNDVLSGGLGSNKLAGGAGDDTYLVMSSVDKITEKAGGGFDTVQSDVSYTLGKNVEALVLTGTSGSSGFGNEEANIITGNGTRNILFGNGGNDSLNGGDGLDDLHGGAGNDTLTGGTGNDLFIFDAAKNAGIDLITDYRANGEADRIQLDNSAFKALPLDHGLVIRGLTTNEFYAGTTAHDADDRVIYDQATGNLFYDADGNGTKFAQVQIAVVGTSTHPTLGFTDFQVIA